MHAFQRRNVVPESTEPRYPGPTTRINHGIDQIVTPKAAGGGGGGALTHPFQITDTTIGAGTARFHVSYGTLEDVEPANVETNIVVGNGTWTVYLDLEIDINGVFVAATLSQATTGQPADTDYHGYITIGRVVVAGGIVTSVSQACTHSLRYAMCGRVVAAGPTLTDPGVYEFWGF